MGIVIGVKLSHSNPPSPEHETPFAVSFSPPLFPFGRIPPPFPPRRSADVMGALPAPRACAQVIIAGGISPSTAVGEKGYTNFGGYIHFAAGLSAGTPPVPQGWCRHVRGGGLYIRTMNKGKGLHGGYNDPP